MSRFYTTPDGRSFSTRKAMAAAMERSIERSMERGMELEQVPILKFSKASKVPWKRDEDCGTIGAGSHSSVFRAVKGNEVVAIKEIRPPGAQDGQSVVEATKLELQLLRICRHPNILRYVAAYTNEKVADRIYIVTTPWADMNLGDFLGFGRSPSKAASCPWWQGTSFARCCLLFKGLLDGLDYLHSHQIFHKDIKPENILLLGSRPILADFGTSKLYRPNRTTNFTKSTYCFLAPEQIQHESSTLQSDIFAMGCCLLFVRTLSVLGHEGIVALDDLLDMPGTSAQFGDPTTIGGMLNILRRRDSKDKPDFWRQSYLDLLIRDMILEVPSERPSAKAAAKSVRSSYCEATFADEILSLPTGTMSVSDALDSTQFEQPDIAMLSTIQHPLRSSPSQVVPRTEELDISDDTISGVDSPGIAPGLALGLLGLASDGSPADAITVTVTVDTGSNCNLMSTCLLDRLIAADLELGIKDEEMALMSIGGNIRIRRSIECRLVYPLPDSGNTEPSIVQLKFLIIDEAEAFFEVLIGVEALLLVKSSARKGASRPFHEFLNRLRGINT